ncbi:DUF72 domain-containing protein [Vibrio agarivorans]|uniref:DUF72 domain-containing protein n=1 Tax=Vibrio agarivorans TaxID=153622 RepID=UPI0025B3C974|nr:DUF72 domain-containing protein [Vibrio agarivorans]MDN3659604.1 DUF72 domain-containing protein [Vibrio agarivorans]
MTYTPVRLGLTLWSHNQWQQSFYGKGTQPSERLEKYARVFHTVEGNTTFYATPNAQTVLNWRDATPETFRFTFKLPKQITHEQQLTASQGELVHFLKVMEPLAEKVGQWTIQLPSSFGFDALEKLQRFTKLFPRDYNLGIEVRNPIFFAKGDEESQLNSWLNENGINRVIMDSRPVFAAKPTTEAVIDAHQKKPRVPVHAIATATRPMIRFIGHPDLEANDTFFAPWLDKLPQWIEQGVQPYVMIHTPDNVLAPELATRLYTQLQNRLTETNTPLDSLNNFPAKSTQPQFNLF